MHFSNEKAIDLLLINAIKSNNVEFVKLVIEDYKLDKHFQNFNFYTEVQRGGFIIDYKYQV